MKFSFVSVGLLALLSPLTAAWSKEDREIFRIRDEISAHATDAAATFYDILGVPPSASQDDITKAYRAQSRSLHPDKVKQKLKSDHKKREKAAEAAAAAGNGGAKPKAPTSSEIRAAVKAAEEAQTRLSLIANILKGPERDRYDHFLRNGFPLWKGTDYYYNRYRPGLGTAIVGVVAFCGGAVHYLILYMNWKRHTEFIDRYIRFARDTAWGGTLNVPEVDAAPPAPAAEEPEDDNNNAPPQPMNRKERRFQEKQARKEDGRPVSKKAARKAPAQSSSSSRSASATPTGVRKRVVAENGKILVVDSAGDVYLEEEDEEGNVGEYLLDPNELAKPTVMDTAVVRVPLWAFRSTIGRFLPQPAVPGIEVTAAGAAADGDNAQDESESASPSQQNTPATDSAGEDFEMISKSTDSLGRAKTSGAQQGGKANKRKGRKK